MQVKKIHFLDSIPGQPVYEMEDKTIRIPFPDGKTGAILWLSEQECLNCLTTKTPENKNIIVSQFTEIRKALGLKVKGNTLIMLPKGAMGKMGVA